MSKLDPKVQTGFRMLFGSVHHIERQTVFTGKFNADGTLNPDPRDGLPSGYIWVRMNSSRAATRIKNLTTSSLMADVPVIVAYNIDTKELEVIGVDPMFVDQDGDRAIAASVPVTPPQYTSTLIGGENFTPGLTYADPEYGGLYVYIAPHFYPGGYFPGGRLELTAPPTADHKAWVAWGINRVTGALQQVMGAEVVNVDMFQLLPGDLDDIVRSYPNILFKGAVGLANGDTELSGKHILDFREWGTHTARHHYAATAAPDASDDIYNGYQAGSLWVDAANGNAYICVDATAGTAVWVQLNGGSGTDNTDSIVTDADFNIVVDALGNVVQGA